MNFSYRKAFAYAFLLATLTGMAHAQEVGTLVVAAGNGKATPVADGGAAVDTALQYPVEVAFDASGNWFIAERDTYKIRRVDRNGILTTYAGSGLPELGSGDPLAQDGIPATEAHLNMGAAVVADPDGNVYFPLYFDRNNNSTTFTDNRIRKVSPDGVITTFAGRIGGTMGGGSAGEGESASTAGFNIPYGLAFDAAGRLYVALSWENKVRRVDTEGIVTTYAGGGSTIKLPYGDGGPATQARLALGGDDLETGFWGKIALDLEGNLYIADGLHNRVRKVDTNGIISTYAGTGAAGVAPFGDGGAATQAQIKGPDGLAVDVSGNLFIADSGHRRIRKVSPDGIITTVAGGGKTGVAGGPATGFRFGGDPVGVTLDSHGNLFVTVPGINRVYEIFQAGAPGLLAGQPFPRSGATIPGDLNVDGALDVRDAVLSLQIAIGLLRPTVSMKGTGDLNGDGALDVSDSVLILRKAAGVDG